MREILFRGKRKDNGEWIEGYYCGKTCETIFSPAIDSAQIIDINLYWHEVIPETVGQYTGLTDKNGTKIFEGDIIREQYGCSYDDFRVEFINGNFVMVYIRTNRGKYAWYGENGEVIGNIHDNPELLEVSDNA